MLEEAATLAPPYKMNLRLLLKMEVLRSTIKAIQMGKEWCRITEYEKSMQKEIKAFAKGLTAACEQSDGRKMTQKRSNISGISPRALCFYRGNPRTNSVFWGNSVLFMGKWEHGDTHKGQRFL